MQTVKPSKKKLDLEFESIKEEDEDGIQIIQSATITT